MKSYTLRPDTFTLNLLFQVQQLVQRFGAAPGGRAGQHRRRARASEARGEPTVAERGWEDAAGVCAGCVRGGSAGRAGEGVVMGEWSGG